MPLSSHPSLGSSVFILNLVQLVMVSTALGKCAEVLEGDA